MKSSAVSQMPPSTARKMWFTLLLPMLMFSSSALATTYCVSNAGDDAASGVATGTNCSGTVSPWRTIGHVNAQDFKPGDSILFEAGGLWREELTPHASGTANKPLLFGAYGTGAKPVLDGSDLVSAWSFVRDVQRGGVADGSVYAAQALTKPAAVWFTDVLGIRKQSIAALKAKHDWYWSSGILYIYSASSPVEDTVEAGSRNDVLLISQVNYVTVNGLDIRHSNGAGVYVRSSCYSVLENLSIHDTVSHGVYLGISGGGHTIQTSEIFNVGVASTFGGGNGIQTDTSLTLPSMFQHNSIHDVGNSVGGDHAIYDQSPGDISSYNRIYNVPGRSSTGMKIDGDHARVYGNTFYNIPSGGIWIDAYSDIQVHNNTFYNVGTISPYAAVSFTGNGAQSGVSVENNIFYVPGRAYSTAISLNGNATGFSSNYNDVYGEALWYGQWSDGTAYLSRSNWTRATGQDANSVSTDPLFVDAPHANFSLQSTSQVLSAGSVVDNPDASVSGPDIGAIPFCASKSIQK